MQKVLFVDDDPLILKSIERVLKSEMVSWGYEMVQSGAEALELIGKGCIDVVVTDIKMPQMDGIELLELIKTNIKTQRIPVIMLTIASDIDIRKVALKRGAIDFLNKPFDPDELTTRLRNVLRIVSFENQLKYQNKKLEEQLIQSQNMENLGVLSSGIVHDLNNVLSNILGNADVATHKIDKSNTAFPYIERIKESSQYAGKLVKQFLALGRRTFEKSDACDLVSVIRENLELLKVSIPDKISVTWEEPKESVWINVDATSMHQVLMNIFINAVDAMNGYGQLNIEFHDTEPEKLNARENALDSNDKYVKLVISDNGEGMDESTRAKVFNTFFTTKPPGKGTGLGMAVVKRIIDNVSGVIEFDSTPGEGTAFSIYLPVTSPREQLVKV